MRTGFTITVLSALLVLGVALPAVAREPIAVGAATPGGHSPNDLHLHFTALDAWDNPERQPAFWTIWSQWGSGKTQDFPTDMLNELDFHDMNGIVWWQPYDPSDPFPGGEKYARHKKTYNGGVNDAYITKWAKDAKAWGIANPGRTVFIRLAHEANGKFFDWRVGNWDNTASTYKKFWRYVYDIFKAEGALPYVDFIWSPFAAKYKLYPGNAYVDYVDPLALNWGDDDWLSLYKTLKKQINKLKDFTSKPIMVTELGSSPSGGNKAKWIENGYPKVYQTWNKVKALIYLDTDQPKNQLGHPDWSLDKPPAALDAYIVQISKPKFQGDAPS